MTRHFVLAGMAATVGLWGSVGAVRGEITSLSGSAKAETTQYVDGAQASTDVSTESFPGTSSSLPIEAFAGLGDFQGVREVGHGARSVASLADPTLVSGADPMELGAEAGSFSTVEHVTYTATSDVEESRVIVLSAGDLTVGSNGAQTAISRVFIEGAIIVWSEDATRDLSGLAGRFHVDIAQDAGSNGSQVVDSHELHVLGAANGEVSVSQTNLPGIIVGGPEVLATGDASVQAVIDELSTIGVVHVILLERTEFPYIYEADPDVSFNLTATVHAEATSLPEGTGVAVVFGRAAEAIGTIFSPILDSSKTATLQHAVNLAIKDNREIAGNGSGYGCGAGVMGLPLISALGLVAGRRWSRGR